MPISPPPTINKIKFIFSLQETSFKRAVKQWNLQSTHEAHQPQLVAGNPDLPASRPVSIVSLESSPERRPHRHRSTRRGGETGYDGTTLPRGHWEYNSGDTHAGEYAQNFNSSASSGPSSSSGEGIQMAAIHPGRGRGRGGTARGPRGGGQSSLSQQQRQVPAAYQQPLPQASGRQVQYQDQYSQQQQHVVYKQPGLQSPMVPQPAMVRERDRSSGHGHHSGRPRSLLSHGSRYERSRRFSNSSTSRSRSRHGSESRDDCCC